MQRCEVLIVGGGPAGSTCAWKLKRAGIDVLVLDKKSFPRDKICAGWVTPAVIRTLGLDIGDYTQAGRTFQPITGFRTGVIGGTEVDTRYAEPVSYGIRRFEFDAYLLARSGAPLAEPAPPGPSPRSRSTSARSLSPRPERFTTREAPGPSRCASTTAALIAWALSSAGRIPSIRDRRSNASSASASVTET